MKTIVKFMPVLHMLRDRRIDKKTKKALLQSTQVTRILCECCLNILKGNVKLNKLEKNRLKKYRRLLRRLADKKHKSLKSKATLIQKGGGAFLPLLLGPILSLITSAITK